MDIVHLAIVACLHAHVYDSLVLRQPRTLSLKLLQSAAFARGSAVSWHSQHGRVHGRKVKTTYVEINGLRRVRESETHRQIRGIDLNREERGRRGSQDHQNRDHTMWIIYIYINQVIQQIVSIWR